MYIIYHNPRCKKSREALEYLEIKNIDYEVILYLENNLSLVEIKNLLNKLKIHPKEIVRMQEQVWKENFKNKDLNSNQYYKILTNYPKLIERPIVTYLNNGVIAKPIENLKKFIEIN